VPISIYNLPKERNILLREASFGVREPFSGLPWGDVICRGTDCFLMFATLISVQSESAN
jgi:hypothetical protein